MKTLAPYLSHWRTIVARDREITEAVVRPDHLGPSDSLAAALAEWPGLYYWGARSDAHRLVLVRALAPARRERWWLHGLLFFLTFFTVWMGGALLMGVPTSTFSISFDGGHIATFSLTRR